MLGGEDRPGAELITKKRRDREKSRRLGFRLADSFEGFVARLARDSACAHFLPTTTELVRGHAGTDNKAMIQHPRGMLTLVTFDLDRR
jgi:hypothetical protein